MLLVVDAGNTNTVFAVYDGEDLKGKWRLTSDAKRTSDEYAFALSQLMGLSKLKLSDVKDVIISTVVPQTVFNLRKLALDYFGKVPLVVGADNVDTGIEIHIERKGDVGADRIVNSVAAFKKFGGDLIILDFGTATTFDVVGSKGEYLGGVISPGVNLSIEALRMAAAKLPEVAVVRPEKVIGDSTISAMQSGVYFGYIGLIEGITKRIKEEYGKDMKVIATGGLASLFIRATDMIDELAPDLTIEGLKHIFDLNQK